MSTSGEHVAAASSDEAGSPPVNPFASFAFGEVTAVPALAPASAPRPSAGAKRKTGISTLDGTQPAASKKRKDCKAERVDFAEMSAEDLRHLRARWRGVADRDAPVEDQRFQVLVGAVLSSRAQASVVDEGLSRLRARTGGLTAATMSEISQDELADTLRRVHWNKAKAKHIRESAAMIVRRHRGLVPRRKGDLLALPGVGPALVEILVNVYDSWESDDATKTATAADRCCAGGVGSEGSGAACRDDVARSGADATAAAAMAAAASGGVDTDADDRGDHGSEAKTRGDHGVKVEEQHVQASCRVGAGVGGSDGCGGGAGGGNEGETAAARRSGD